jgi:hypothetical protein
MRAKQSLFIVITFLFASSEGLNSAFLSQTEASEPVGGRVDSSWVDARVKAWQPSKAERAFDEIGWVQNLTEAERLAQEHRRPIFLFTYDGSDLACFRC